MILDNLADFIESNDLQAGCIMTPYNGYTDGERVISAEALARLTLHYKTLNYTHIEKKNSSG